MLLLKARHMNRKTFSALLLSFALLSACGGNGNKDGEKIGTAAGAVIGTVIGAKSGSGSGKVLSAGLGAIFGAWIGKIIGRHLDEMDQQQANEKAQEAMDTADVGQTTSWSNPDTGNSGTYTPTSARTDANGEQCRDFESTIIIDGKQEQASGRACRQDDGAWKIVE
jgi:surface antigen